LRFSSDEIDYLKGLPTFSHVPPEFFDYLHDFKFSGDVWAMPEGTPFFPPEPIMRITAPILEAQLLETYLLSTVNFQTMIASKAARIVQAAEGRGVVEFGSRRAHGMEAGLFAARAAFIGGCVGTSNVEAGFKFGIPVSGTMAHSWVMSYPSEHAAFKAYVDLFPETAVLLLDTYDTVSGAKLAVELNANLKGVRLDSGDLCDLSKKIRQILNDGDHKNTKILASGDLDENSITKLLADSAPIDLFGVGTMLSTSWDAPSLGGVYKLVEQTADGKTECKMKLSAAKSFYPGAKQVWRHFDERGICQTDTLSRHDETIENSEPLLECVMQNGQIVKPSPSLIDIQKRANQSVNLIPAEVRRMKDPAKCEIKYSPALEDLRSKVMSEIESQHRQ
jgi:nicotinate phosphoribosyltransferase